MVGSVQRVLVERGAKKGQGELAARTENNRWVNFSGPASLLQHFVDVLITEARPHSLRGRYPAPAAAATATALASAAPARRMAGA